MKRLMMWAVVVAGLAVAAPVVTADPFFMSPEDEARIGAEQHPKILAEFGGAYEDPELVAYVDSIGQFLALTSERPGVKYTFTVLNSKVVNAFALPGGYIYVTRGLLALASTEAEIAGVIAHEIGHVAARHGAERYSNSIIANLGVAVLGILTDSPGLANVAQVGAMAVLQSYSREDEFEADTLGVRYLSRAGFDTRAMASFLSKLKAHSEVEAHIHGQQPAQGLDIMATHPRTADRVQRAIQAARVSNVANPIVAEDIYLDKINGMLFGDDPEQGLVKGRRFVHPVLGFQYEVPDGFILLNGQDAVLSRNADGAIIRFDGDRRQRGERLTTYVANTWLPEARLSNLESLRVNGFDAATATTLADGPQGKLDVRVVAIGFDSRTIYRFMFATPQNVTRALSEPLRRTLYSFRALSDREARNIRPLKLRVHNVRRGDTQQSVASMMRVDGYGLARFRVLNGIYPNRDLRPGRLVKIVTE